MDPPCHQSWLAVAYDLPIDAGDRHDFAKGRGLEGFASGYQVVHSERPLDDFDLHRTAKLNDHITRDTGEDIAKRRSDHGLAINGEYVVGVAFGHVAIEIEHDRGIRAAVPG